MSLAIMPVFIRLPSEAQVVQRAVESFYETTDGTTQLLIVDDGSPLEGAIENLRKRFTSTVFYRQANSGFSAAVNVGLSMALESGEDAVLINSDIEFFEPGWLQVMEDNPADVVGAMLIYPNGLIQHGGIYFSIIHRVFGHIHQYSPHTISAAQRGRECPVTAALQFIRRSALEEVGVYDPKFRLGWEDVAYCTDVFNAGLKCAYEPAAKAIHHEGLFRRSNPSKRIQEWQVESWRYLHEKYAGMSFADWCPTLIGDGQNW